MVNLWNSSQLFISFNFAKYSGIQNVSPTPDKELRTLLYA